MLIARSALIPGQVLTFSRHPLHPIRWAWRCCCWPDLRLHLLQFVETSRSYVVTLTALEQYQPAEVLVVASQHEEVATGLNDATRRLRQVWPPRGPTLTTARCRAFCRSEFSGYIHC